jgi:hypothetical protein
MATCKDCLHFEVCVHRYEELCKGTKVEDLLHNCTKFKDRNKYIDVDRCEDCTHRDNPVTCPMWIKQGLCYRGEL